MPKINEKVLGYIVLVLIAGLTSVIGFYVAKKIEKSEQPPQIIVQQIEKQIVATSTSLYPEFDSLSIMKNLVLLSGVKSYTPNGDTETYSHKKYFQVMGEFSKIYLYIEASFNDAKLTGGQDIYIKFQNQGGHIKNKPLLVPESKISRFLYDADNIQYVETIKNPKIEAVSWLDIFNDIGTSGKTMRMDAFISSRKEVWIEKMEFYYQCSRDVECSIVEVK